MIFSMATVQLTVLVALVVSVVAVYAETDANTLNLEINIEYDPCLLKQCPGDHECRVVNHAELLEIPVAACVTRKTRPTESGQCKTHSVGTNILNCKTVSEWIAIGETQCSVLDTELELQKRSLKTKYVCHQKTGEQFQYLSVEFDCCRKETPSVLTVATPDTTTPVRPKEDGWTATGGGSEPPKLEETSYPVYDTVAFGTIKLATEEHPSESHDDDDNEIQQDADNGGLDDATLIFIVIFALVCCIAALLGLTAYARIVTNRRAKSGYEKPTTVFVNPNCDDYKLALHETSKYADIFY